jgi:FG-GAP-like repeat
MVSEKRRIAGLVVVSLLACALSYSAEATVGFKSPVSYSVGTVPLAVAAGDFNGDGKPDLAVANAGNPATGDDGNVSILLGNGDGTFQPALTVAAGKNPFAIAVGDFNGDGRLDVVVANNGINPAGGWLAGTVSVLLGNGDGTFQQHVDYATGDDPESVAVGDFNGDHVLDLAVATRSDSAMSVLLGNGDGTFQPHVDYAAGYPTAVAIADFNRDGKADLAVAGAFNGGVVGILEGNGDGTFQPAVGYLPAVGRGWSVASGDFNGDGKVDLVVSGYGVPVSVLLGNGDGTFAQGSTLDTFSAGCHAGSPVVADFDGDGKLDVAVTAGGAPHDGLCLWGGAETILVFKGNGDGTFQPPASFTTTSAFNLAATADLDGDKAPDLVTVNGSLGRGDNTVSVVLNSTGAEFSISAAAPIPATVSRGQRATSTVTLAHLNAFDDPVALSCSVQPAPSAPSCSLNPNSVSFDANGNATATLTLSTGPAMASVVPAVVRYGGRPLGFLWLPLAGFALMGAGLGCRSSKRLVRVALGALVLAGLIFQAACNGGSSGQPYTVTVTGTSDATQHVTTATLTVQ